MVALELSSGECGAAIQPGTSWALAALDRPPNGRIADLSAKSNGLTQIPGVMWEVASLSKSVGPTPDRHSRLRMPLLRRRPIQNLKSQVYHIQLHAQVGKGVRLEFKLCLVGLGKDAGETASTDWIAFQSRSRSRSMPHQRRHKTTPRIRGPCTCTQ